MENLARTAEKLDGTGVRYLVIDCGWDKSPEKDNWFNAAGDWIPGKELFPDGDIKAAADMIRSHGLIPGLCAFGSGNSSTVNSTASRMFRIDFSLRFSSSHLLRLFCDTLLYYFSIEPGSLQRFLFLHFCGWKPRFRDTESCFPAAFPVLRFRPAAFPSPGASHRRPFARRHSEIPPADKT